MMRATINARAGLRLLFLLIPLAATNAALPEPPRQHEAWTPPASGDFPSYIVAESALFFDAGLADPRGGEYGEIDISSEDRIVRTHGWVFPGHFAVCWNGLVYKLRGIDKPANLDLDVRAIATPDGRAPYIRQPNPQIAFLANVPSRDVRGPIQIALLLRLGRSDLARQIWSGSEWSSGHGDIRSESEWLKTVAWAWLGAAFLRLVDERSAGDDAAAVEIAESLLVWGPRMKEAWAKIPHSVYPAPISTIAFLEPVPALLADSRRRLTEPPRPKRDFVVLAAQDRANPKEPFFAEPQTARVTELIQALENVHAEKISMPGNLQFMFDPICGLLAAEGAAAVEPLLDAYETDQRLTRTVDYVRPWAIERTPIPVKTVANAILESILQVPGLVDDSDHTDLRAWWRKHNDQDPILRSFKILADDSSTPEEWVASADTITLRSDIGRTGKSLSVPQGTCVPGEPVAAPAGEALRARSNPSVTELLAKRTAASVRLGGANPPVGLLS